MQEKEENEKDENKNTNNIEIQNNNPKKIIIKKKKKEKIGPTIKKCKTNKAEDKELQIACEDKEERKERLKEEKKLKEKEKQRKKEEELKNKNLIYKIDEENYNCADCGKSKSTYLSINNGITLCDSCSEQHKLLGHSISYVRSINDKLDEYLFNFIVFGSNTRFKRFIKKENLDENLSIKIKYKTKALYFYRKALKNKVKGIPNPIKDYNDPNIIEENNTEDDFPEFINYNIQKQIIEKGEFKKESKILNILSKLISKNENKKKIEVTLLRSKSSVNEELKKETAPTFGDDLDKISKSKKKPNPPINYDIDKIKESSRPINDDDDKNETEKSDEVEDTAPNRPTTEQIINHI